MNEDGPEEDDSWGQDSFSALEDDDQYKEILSVASSARQFEQIRRKYESDKKGADGKVIRIKQNEEKRKKTWFQEILAAEQKPDEHIDKNELELECEEREPKVVMQSKESSEPVEGDRERRREEKRERRKGRVWETLGMSGDSIATDGVEGEEIHKEKVKGRWKEKRKGRLWENIDLNLGPSISVVEREEHQRQQQTEKPAEEENCEQTVKKMLTSEVDVDGTKATQKADHEFPQQAEVILVDDSTFLQKNETQMQGDVNAIEKETCVDATNIKQRDETEKVFDSKQLYPVTDMNSSCDGNNDHSQSLTSNAEWNPFGPITPEGWTTFVTQIQSPATQKKGVLEHSPFTDQIFAGTNMSGTSENKKEDKDTPSAKKEEEIASAISVYEMKTHSRTSTDKALSSDAVVVRKSTSDTSDLSGNKSIDSGSKILALAGHRNPNHPRKILSSSAVNVPVKDKSKPVLDGGLRMATYSEVRNLSNLIKAMTDVFFFFERRTSVLQAWPFVG